jgi:branched-chain amino acid transport system ATP-binding protein
VAEDGRLVSQGQGPERLLEAVDLSAGYGSLAAVRNLNLHVDEGEIVALLGANGAGKTTTILTLSGELPPIGGEVRWLGEPASRPLHVRARQGLSLVTEEKSVFMGLSVAENLRLGRGDPALALELFPELGDHLDRRCGLLSGGQQQMLTLARALAGRPRVLLADELSLGLAPILVGRLLEAVRRAVDTQGTGVLLVEQHVRQALRWADRIYVLQRGTLVLEDTAASARGRIEEIERSYLDDAAVQ